jgi:hypothetical protein
MKTVGIFGDSFADCTYLKEWKTIHKNIGLGWPELLAFKYKVTNFSAGGSGMYYSYDLFKKMQSNFDIIVFVPSHAARFSLFFPDKGQVHHLVPGFLLNQAEQELKNNKYLPNDTKIIKAAIDYVSYILNQTKEDEMKRLMLEEIKRLRPDTIFIPAFSEDSISGAIELFHVSTMELTHYETSWDKLRKCNPPFFDFRKCHMTEGNNRLVFNKVVEAIANKDTVVRIFESDFVAPTDPFNKYFAYDITGRTNI